MSKPVLSYARPDTRSTFQANEHDIYIDNGPVPLHKWICWLIAALFIALPFVQALLSHTIPFAWGDPGQVRWTKWLLYVLLILCLMFVSVQSSSVRIDLVALRVISASRVGLYHCEETAPLSKFDRVALDRDSEGASLVRLAGKDGTSIEVMSGRNRRDTIRAAKEIASRLSLPLDGYNPEEEWS
jgi:hypothetical protein